MINGVILTLKCRNLIEMLSWVPGHALYAGYAGSVVVETALETVSGGGGARRGCAGLGGGVALHTLPHPAHQPAPAEQFAGSQTIEHSTN